MRPGADVCEHGSRCCVACHFGAVGDGEHDDTEAVQAFIEAIPIHGDVVGHARMGHVPKPALVKRTIVL